MQKLSHNAHFKMKTPNFSHDTRQYSNSRLDSPSHYPLGANNNLAQQLYSASLSFQQSDFPKDIEPHVRTTKQERMKAKKPPKEFQWTVGM